MINKSMIIILLLVLSVFLSILLILFHKLPILFAMDKIQIKLDSVISKKNEYKRFNIFDNFYYLIAMFKKKFDKRLRWISYNMTDDFSE